MFSLPRIRIHPGELLIDVATHRSVRGMHPATLH